MVINSCLIRLRAHSTGGSYAWYWKSKIDLGLHYKADHRKRSPPQSPTVALGVLKNIEEVGNQPNSLRIFHTIWSILFSPKIWFLWEKNVVLYQAFVILSTWPQNIILFSILAFKCYCSILWLVLTWNIYRIETQQRKTHTHTHTLPKPLTFY